MKSSIKKCISLSILTVILSLGICISEEVQEEKELLCISSLEVIDNKTVIICKRGKVDKECGLQLFDGKKSKIVKSLKINVGEEFSLIERHVLISFLLYQIKDGEAYFKITEVTYGYPAKGGAKIKFVKVKSYNKS